ncbi:MAG: DUF3300 domain-containing protein [Pseudomonadota bacterium]|nr:DUF3300 domain-containing protein [Pseudomonadota bacterium]
MNHVLRRRLVAVALIAALPGTLLAQGTYMGSAERVRGAPPVWVPPNPGPAADYGAPAPVYGAPAAVAPAPQDELDALLAPIALYPDQLLAQVLMAATFPLDVVEAARFVQHNPGLKGPTLDNALARRNWDPSVLSLAAFPQVLLMMNERVEWTRRLGEAFLADQDRVMQTVQDLRFRAQSVGNLVESPQQRVIVENRTIYIEPAQPDVIYVPTYNPTVVYGSWWAPAYVPFYWRPPRMYYPAVVGTGLIGFGVGYYVTNNHWGWARPDWRSRHIAIEVGRGNHFIERRPYYREGIRDGWWQHRGGEGRDYRAGPGGRSPGPQFTPGREGRPPRYDGGVERPRAAAPDVRGAAPGEYGGGGRGRWQGGDGRLAHGDNPGSGPVVRAPRTEGGDPRGAPPRMDAPATAREQREPPAVRDRAGAPEYHPRQQQ